MMRKDTLKIEDWKKSAETWELIGRGTMVKSNSKEMIEEVGHLQTTTLVTLGMKSHLSWIDLLVMAQELRQKTLHAWAVKNAELK